MYNDLNEVSKNHNYHNRWNQEKGEQENDSNIK